MKFHYIEEPLLEFSKDTHICPRAGITNHDVYDTKIAARRERLLIGAIGTSQTLTKLAHWLERCAQPIPPKADNNQPELYLAFCGFNKDVGFKAEFALVQEITRTLNVSDVRQIIKIPKWNERIDNAVELYYKQAEFLARHRNVDVIVCVLPNELYDRISREAELSLEESIEEEPDDLIENNFRRSLKARAMHLGIPLQLVREQSLEDKTKGGQDAATRAWNFCTALYYKANRTVPWKIPTNINRPAICFAGIGFFRSRDRATLHTSLAQIFDELGNGVILRGNPVDMSKDDRVPHLTAEQAHDLLALALTEYETALNHAPGRLVLHKSSNYNDAELDGFRAATREMRVNTVDFVTIMDTQMRLVREGVYPPYRGTHIELDTDTHILYTRGSVKYYRTYPGKYVPQPLEIRIVEADESPEVICSEILSLTKMNWNNTQFDRKYPITIECARKVGQIMKYLDPDEDPEPQISYSFYM